MLEPEGEAFWVLLEGEMTFEVGDETIKASPGSFVFGTRDRYTVESGPARRTLPPPPEGSPSEAEMEQLVAVARQYGCELLG